MILLRLNNKKSPRLCLLLKTLLFLLCIYIKRVTSEGNCFPSSGGTTPADTYDYRKFGATIDYCIIYDEQASKLNEVDYVLKCHLDDLITLKNSNKIPPKHLKLDAIKQKITSVWMKNDGVLHRDNGNYMKKYGTDLLLFSVGESDEGTYSCLPDYTKLPKAAYEYYNFAKGSIFEFHVLKNPFPDIAPAITHPPTDTFVAEGQNLTIQCKSIEVLLNPATYWYKSCNFYNTTSNCSQQFEYDFKRAYNSKDISTIITTMRSYEIKNPSHTELELTNITAKDVAHYGCLTYNNKGYDFRKAKIQILSMLTPEKSPNITNEFTSPENGDRLKTSYQELPDPKISIAATVQKPTIPREDFYILLGAAIFMTFCAAMAVPFIYAHWKQEKYHNLNSHSPVIVGNNLKNVENQKQHLPTIGSADIYNVGKSLDGYITGQLMQSNGHLMAQSICTRVLNKSNNPSIISDSSNSSNENNTDEASSWGKTLSSHGDNSRAFYQHTSDTTRTTIPMYDHLPSSGISTGTTTLLCEALVQDACAINPTYGILPGSSSLSNNNHFGLDWNYTRRNLVRLEKIGEGNFGEVWRYLLDQQNGGKRFVAVKQVKNITYPGDQGESELLAEMEVMKSVNDHPNVIKFLDCCRERGAPLLLIMEFAELGKLQAYLRSCRSSSRLKPEMLHYCSNIIEDGCLPQQHPQIASKDLVKFSYHIAKGMEYIASKGIIHRDLASRNILLSKEKICKVADFGFARRVTDDCAYQLQTRIALPIKWMAPEALAGKFTSKSDVYSLGILMWEIVTLGATPYEDLDSEEVIKKVKAGERLSRPAHCKDEFFNIMSRCWRHDPDDRPTFRELALELETLLLSENNYIELDQYPEHAYYNINHKPEKEEIVNTTLIEQ